MLTVHLAGALGDLPGALVDLPTLDLGNTNVRLRACEGDA